MNACHIGGIFDTEIRRHYLVQDAIERGDAERVAWARQRIFANGDVHNKHGYETVERELTHNLIPTAGLDFVLNLTLGNAPKVSNWYVGIITSSHIPAADWRSNWSGSSSGPEATELPDASYIESGRQPIVFGAASNGVIEHNTPAVFTLAAGVTGVTAYGLTINSTSTVAYNNIDKILLAATQYATAKTGLDAGDEIRVGYKLTLANAP